MKIREILAEQLNSTITHSLPHTEVFPNLTNTDPYVQYRFGLAIASAKAAEAGHVEYQRESDFGERLAIVAPTKEEQDIIRLAKKLYGKDSDSIVITTEKSQETEDTNKISPVAKLGPVKRKS